MRTPRVLWISILGLAMLAQPAMAEPTEVVVRVIAKGAKFVGTETGGAQVTLRDVESGNILAQGLTTGGTGSTPQIMTEAHTRAGTLSDDKSAKFSATLNLDHPRLISATVKGPMISDELAVSVSSTQWVVPGKPVNGGDAWVLELPGFIIELATPLPATIKLAGTAQKVPLLAKIRMQCGCPITPDGLWDANKLEIGAILHRGNKSYPAIPLAYSGTPSTFSGEIEIGERGNYTLDLYAYAPWDGNTGVRQFRLRAN